MNEREGRKQTEMEEATFHKIWEGRQKEFHKADPEASNLLWMLYAWSEGKDTKRKREWEEGVEAYSEHRVGTTDIGTFICACLLWQMLP